MNTKEFKASVEVPLIQQEKDERKVYNKREDIVAEVKRQLMLAGPLVTVSFLIYFLQVISVMFVGHLGELALSGASMATSFASVTGFSLLKGMATALETFCGQSYGAKQYHMLGIHLQRAVIVLLLASIPLAILWANAGHILVFLGQDPEISAEAGLYARFLIPSIIGFVLQECHVRFLQAQNNVFPMMIFAGITTASHVLTCYTLVFKSGLGSKGAALANAISYMINALLLMLYVRISPSCKSSRTGLSFEALCGISEYVKLSIPSALMISLETWSFEMMVLLGGLLPNPKLEASVLSISLNTGSMAYMIPLGLSNAISTRVANELGARKPQAVRLAIHVAICLATAEAIIATTVMILGRNVWGQLYSREERIVKYVGQMLVFVSMSHFVDCIQSIQAGICRGCGRQNIGAVINLGAYYLVGIPCSVVLAFVFHLGGKGLWTGLIVAISVQALLLSVLTVRTNWEKETKRATERVLRSNIDYEEA
ncbi:hypothetical protein ACFE04_010667 [Oxalis oulophora]